MPNPQRDGPSNADLQQSHLGEGEGDVLLPFPRGKVEAGYQLAGIAGKRRHRKCHKKRRDARCLYVTYAIYVM
jgi:hypothetical protein